MVTPSQHVVRRGSQWAVRKSESVRVTRRFSTQREAIEVARRLARKQGCDVYIFDPDGFIRDYESYSNGSASSKG